MQLRGVRSCSDGDGEFAGGTFGLCRVHVRPKNACRSVAGIHGYAVWSSWCPGKKKNKKKQEGVALLLSFPPWCSDAGQWRRSSRQKSCGSQLRSPNAFVGLAHAWWQGGTHQGLCPSNILRSGTPRICGALLEFTVNYIISMILASSQL